MPTNQPLVTLVPWTVVAQICNLLLQMWLFKKFLYKPVMDIIKKRQQITDQPLADAEKARDEALAMKAEYEQNMAQAKAQADQIVQDATRTAALRSEKIVQEARAEAASLKQQAEADIAQQQKKALNDVKDEIGGIAMEIASKVVEREINEQDHAALIDEFIKTVGDAS